jgi:pyrroline-5-carboxylate reductase
MNSTSKLERDQPEHPQPDPPAKQNKPSRQSAPDSIDALIANTRIAVLGAGKMGGILLHAFLQSGLFPPEQIAATVAHESRAQSLASRLGIAVSTSNLEAAEGADVILLGVKPQQMADVVREIAPALASSTAPSKTAQHMAQDQRGTGRLETQTAAHSKLLISFAASVKTSAIEEAAKAPVAVIRAMPNTPAMLGAGVTALCRGRYASEEQLALAQRIFSTVGRTVVVDEKHMDAVTGLSGSGPAFLYIIIEALAEAGVNVGLPRDTATLLAAQTAYGAARMVLETGSHPALLKDEVTTPAGCTVDGILELEEGGLRVTLIKAVKRATQRARELANG